MRMLVASALLVMAASWTAPSFTHRRHARAQQRTSTVTCGAVATFCKRRFSISEALSQKTEAKLKHRAEYIDGTMTARICNKLQSRLGLSEAQLQKVVVAQPQVLGYSFESNIAPKLNFLQRELDLSLTALRECVLARPSLLGYSQDRRFAQRLEACRLAGADPMLIIGRVAMSDARFYSSIGLEPP